VRTARFWNNLPRVRSTFGTRNVWRTWSHFSIGCVILIYPEYMFSLQYGDRRGRECILIGFTTVYAISVFHHTRCEFESRSWCGVLDTTLCNTVCQWLSPGTPLSSTNKTDLHDITEILLKVALNAIILTLTHSNMRHDMFAYPKKLVLVLNVFLPSQETQLFQVLEKPLNRQLQHQSATKQISKYYLKSFTSFQAKHILSY
jgi:hypothetical protein